MGSLATSDSEVCDGAAVPDSNRTTVTRDIGSVHYESTNKDFHPSESTIMVTERSALEIEGSTERASAKKNPNFAQSEESTDDSIKSVQQNSTRVVAIAELESGTDHYSEGKECSDGIGPQSEQPDLVATTPSDDESDDHNEFAPILLEERKRAFEWPSCKGMHFCPNPQEKNPVVAVDDITYERAVAIVPVQSPASNSKGFSSGVLTKNLLHIKLLCENFFNGRDNSN